MATKRGQRIGIAIILAVTIIGTVGSFAVMILSQQNATQEAQQKQKDLADYQAKSAEYQKKLDAQAVELSGKYYGVISPYAARVATYDITANNKDLKTEDLAVGDGEEVTDTTKFAAYYIGWNPNGKVFDQSIKDGALKSPLPIADGLAKASLISGWKEGMKGMKIGGVREMTIPSDKAYGEQGQGDNIPPNTPLKFVVLAVPLPEQFEQPAYPKSLLQGMY